MAPPFLPQETIRKKRDGLALEAAEIERLVEGITEGTVTDAQIAAFAMAVFFKGMEAGEQATLTRAMTESGRVLDWSGIALRGPVVDKHSTGGVGDKVSLVLAPIVAACGAHVPMISGRGLGHTGGTLDKLESIPGYDAAPGLDRFVAITAEVGCSIIGQTAELAPADRRFYAVRDVTATVESVSLITASILSKKLAAGLDGLVMDVKFGSGAFMRDIDEARTLATNICRVAAEADLPASAVLSDMNQVLGDSAGNALEVLECVQFLNGARRAPRLLDCALELAARMITLVGLAAGDNEARDFARASLESGRAAEIFQTMVSAHGGPADFVERPEAHLALAPVTLPVCPDPGGIVAGMDVRRIGLAIVELGGGRTRPDQRIDHSVGLSAIKGIGEAVGPDAPLAIVHARDTDAAERAAARLLDAVRLADKAVEAGPVIRERIGPEDLPS